MTLLFRKCDFIWPNKNDWARTYTTTAQRSFTNENRHKRW